MINKLIKNKKKISVSKILTKCILDPFSKNEYVTTSITTKTKENFNFFILKYFVFFYLTDVYYNLFSFRFALKLITIIQFNPHLSIDNLQILSLRSNNKALFFFFIRFQQPTKLIIKFYMVCCRFLQIQEMKKIKFHFCDNLFNLF